ncbi:aminotransferase class IV [Phenylobacterium sp.]|uniref:aminotransferase class IV n=1 Tax=Phenylobacterium sp. TaxID=1871053 RepID=UPI002FC89432
MIPHDDRGLLLGDGLFETLLAKAGVLVDLEAHLDRLAVGCAALGLPMPDRGEAERLMRQALGAVEAPRAAVRLTLTAGSGGRGLDRPGEPVPRLFASAAPAATPEGRARLTLSAVRRNEGSPASRLKTLAYLDNLLARQEARARGADEAVMLNNRGEVACAAVANLFWVRDGRLFTPALACGVLAGVMRARVIAAAAAELGVEVVETAAEPGELDAAEAVFLTNSLVGLREVAALDAVAYGPSRLAERLARALD